MEFELRLASRIEETVEHRSKFPCGSLAPQLHHALIGLLAPHRNVAITFMAILVNHLRRYDILRFPAGGSGLLNVAGRVLLTEIIGQALREGEDPLPRLLDQVVVTSV